MTWESICPLKQTLHIAQFFMSHLTLPFESGAANSSVFWCSVGQMGLILIFFFSVLPHFTSVVYSFNCLPFSVYCGLEFHMYCGVIEVGVSYNFFFSPCFRVRRSREIFTPLSLIKSSSSHFSFHFYPGLQILSLLPWLPDLYFQT